MNVVLLNILQTSSIKQGHRFMQPLPKTTGLAFIKYVMKVKL